MLGGVSIPTEIVSAIYGNLSQQAGNGMGMCRKCFSNLPFPTEACQEMYPYPPKLFWKFPPTYRGGKGMGMHQKCFSNLPFPTEPCQEVYPYPQKLFQKFTLTYQGMSAKVWGCVKSVL